MAAFAMIRARIVVPAVLALFVTRGLADPKERHEVAAALEGTTAAVSADASAIANTAPAGDERAASGNPLWSIPLASLSATRERPLFSASRRPSPADVTKGAATVVAVAAETSAPPEATNLTLMGTVVGTNVSFAILINSATGAASRLFKGDQESGWRLRSVEPRLVILEKDARSVTLELPKAAEGLGIALARTEGSRNEPYGVDP
jgi:general secretion pathway protein N